MKISLKYLLFLPLIIGLMLAVAMIPLRMMRRAQQEALEAHRAAEIQNIRAIEAAKQRELAQREATMSTSNQGDQKQHAKVSDLRMLTWNVESGGNDPAVIAQQLVDLGRFDLSALQEVHSDNFHTYAAAVNDSFGGTYRAFCSSSGYDDRLMMIYDSARLQLVESRELYHQGEHSLNNGKYRSPLVGRFRDLRDGTVFLVLTVHLARGDADYRRVQAEGLREWGREVPFPVLALGDFNMDYDFATQQGNSAFDALLKGGVWRWVKPQPLVDTNWYDGDGDGADDFPGSMLDFAFTLGDGWNVRSRVMVRPDDFPDDESTSDHRPVEVRVLSHSA